MFNECGHHFFAYPHSAICTLLLPQQATTLRSEIEAAALAAERARIEHIAARDAESVVRARLNAASLAEIKSGRFAEELVARQAEAMTLRWRVSDLVSKEEDLRATLEKKFGPASLDAFKQQTDVLLRRKLSIMEVCEAPHKLEVPREDPVPNTSHLASAGPRRRDRPP